SINGCNKNVILSNEAPEGRYSSQREHEHCHHCRENRLLAPESGIIIECQVLLPFTFEHRKNPERADIHEHVRSEIEENAGLAQLVGCSKSDEHIPCMRNA